MAAPKYKSNLKLSYRAKLNNAQQESNSLHEQIMKLTEKGYSEELMDLIQKRNQQLIIIETMQSRIDNIGSYTGITEQSFPKFNQ